MPFNTEPVPNAVVAPLAPPLSAPSHDPLSLPPLAAPYMMARVGLPPDNTVSAISANVSPIIPPMSLG